jgi:WD40 repeat protein
MKLLYRQNATRRELERQDVPVTRHPEFRYKTEFQSHEPEFDYLKSLEIEEKINKIKWCQTTNNALFLLSTNDKTIKYWKVRIEEVSHWFMVMTSWLTYCFLRQALLVVMSGSYIHYIVQNIFMVP